MVILQKKSVFEKTNPSPQLSGDRALFIGIAKYVIDALHCLTLVKTTNVHYKCIFFEKTKPMLNTVDKTAYIYILYKKHYYEVGETC